MPLTPIVIEQTSKGERSYDILVDFSRIESLCWKDQ